MMVNINTSIEVDTEDIAEQISCHDEEQIHDFILMIESFLCNENFTRNLIRKLEKALDDYGA